MSDFPDALLAMARRVDPDVRAIGGLARLTAGATLETWAFDAECGARSLALVLRRAPAGRPAGPLSLADEAQIVRVAGAHGVPVPVVWHVLAPADGLGDGFVMQRIAGETIPRRILREPALAAARAVLVGQLGATLAVLHRVPIAALPALQLADAGAQLDRLEQEYRQQAQPRPVFDLAIRWLRERLPAPVVPALVHGDYRNGNIIVGAEGLRAVLDWELAHVGDPAEDLAWMQLPPWRFGVLDQPVGGLGAAGDFYAAYEAAGGDAVDPARVRFWQVMGSLRWGVATAGMVAWVRGGDSSVERAMIARRASENELDLLRAILGRE